MKKYLFCVVFILICLVFFMVSCHSSKNYNESYPAPAAEESRGSGLEDHKVSIIEQADRYWDDRLVDKKNEFSEFDNLEVQVSKSELLVGGELDRVAIKDEKLFVQSLKNESGNCDSFSVDKESLENFVSIKVQQAIYFPKLIPATTKLLKNYDRCDQVRISLVSRVIMLGRSYPSSKAVNDLIKHYQFLLVRDLRRSGFNPKLRYRTEKFCRKIKDDNYLDLPRTMLALNELAKLRGNQKEQNLWLLHYADWQTCPHFNGQTYGNVYPELAYDIYQSIGKGLEMKLAAIQAGDRVSLVYMQGGADRSSHVESDKVLAVDWYRKGGLDDQKALIRIGSLGKKK